MLHAISLPPGQFGGEYIDALFLGRLSVDDHPYFGHIADVEVSAHFLVDRMGLLTQYVPVFRRAWHAGQSQWRGRSACNDFSVGIELEGTNKIPFTDRQYQRLGGLVRTLQVGIQERGQGSLEEDDHIVGHEHISPGRKWDPGPYFDWVRFRTQLKRSQPDPNCPLVWY